MPFQGEDNWGQVRETPRGPSALQFLISWVTETVQACKGSS